MNWESIYKDIGFLLDHVLLSSSIRNNLYALLYLVVQEYTLSTVAQAVPLACLRTLDSSFTQVACSYLYIIGFTLFSCTFSLKTYVYASLSPSLSSTLVPVPSMTLTSNISPTTVRIYNTWLHQPMVSTTPNCLIMPVPPVLRGHKSREQLP